MYHALFQTTFGQIWYYHNIILWGNISSKNEVINDRIYWTDDITENFVTECLIKEQTFFESICRKMSAGWMDKFTRKYLWSVVYQHKNNPWIRYMHAADVRYHLDCWLVWVCLPGAIVTTITTSLVYCKCNRQHRWLDIAITSMNAGPVQVYQTCMLVCTSLQIWLLVRCNC